jgi:hypothetical protein
VTFNESNKEEFLVVRSLKQFKQMVPVSRLLSKTGSGGAGGGSGGEGGGVSVKLEDSGDDVDDADEEDAKGLMDGGSGEVLDDECGLYEGDGGALGENAAGTEENVCMESRYVCPFEDCNRRKLSNI